MPRNPPSPGENSAVNQRPPRASNVRIDPQEYAVSKVSIRLVPLSAAAVLAALALSGCGPKSPSEQASGPSSPAADAAQNEAKAQELAAREQDVADREAALKAQQEAAQKQQAEEEQARLDADAAAKARADQDAAARAAAAKRTTGTKAGTTSGAAAAPKAAEAAKPIVVPAGTQLAITLGSAVSTKTAKVGDRVHGQLASDVVVDGRKAAVAGAAISGSVYKVISGSDRVGTTPKLTIVFDSLVASNGATVPIAAKFQQLGQSEKLKDTAKIVGGAAAGAIIGNQVSHKGGAVVGGVIGAGAGTAIASKTGNEVDVPAGAAISASTTAEFQVKPK